MPRYALLVEYDGGGHAGWQWQTGQPTIQGAIEAALARLESDLPRIVAAGRTDAGVHALAQVAQCDLSRRWEPSRLMAALNHHLARDRAAGRGAIAIRDVAMAPEGWHARFSAIERRYLYRVLNRAAPPALERGRVWHLARPLDVDAMAEAAQLLLGRHDFTTFRSSICQAASPVKTLDEFCVTAVETAWGREIHFRLRARSFLHNQVRSLVGTLERVGAGRWQPRDVRAALEARNRAACGPVAPPWGLYLAGVGYPDDPFAAGRS